MNNIYKEFTTSILDGNQEEAWEIFAEHSQHLDTIELFTTIIEKSLIDIGLLWQQNKISVAHEHLATLTVEYILTKYEKLLIPRKALPLNNKTALFSCLEGEEHVIGLRMSAILFKEYGWNTVFLGCDQSLPQVLSSIQEHKPNLVGLSCTMINNAKLLPLYTESINTLKENPRILVGSRLIGYYDLAKHCAASTILVPNLEQMRNLLQKEESYHV